MGAWRRAASTSLHEVSERPDLWVPGALGWIASVGWIPFVVAVVPAPSISDLTFLGARLVTSGTWPWNAVFLGAGLLVIVALAFASVAASNATLAAMIVGRRTRPSDIARMLRVTVPAGLPAAIAIGMLLLAASIVAPREFNDPDPAGGPLVSTIVRLLPYLAVVGLTVLAAIGLSAVGGRIAVARRIGTASALRLAASAIVRPPLAIQLVVSALAAIALLVIAGLLLGVLWSPIAAELGIIGDFGLGTGLLLVGFVAVWLCIVLAGGALHAWSATTWSRLVAAESLQRT
ncbi:MAG: hypothetical protein K5924_05230 [Chloroflexi bacterium]|nr:hypothetical protein [Chloroflexota bacterium]